MCAPATPSHRPIPEPRPRRGSRLYLVSELRQMAEGWAHLGNDKLSRAATEGAAALENGNAAVTVGHTRWEVTDA